MDWKLEKATPLDFDFLWDLHQKTMRNYVQATWGWDEEAQFRFFKDKFVPDDYLLIFVGDERIGCLQYNWHISELRLQIIEILPSYQNHGVGTAIIKSLQKNALDRRRDIALRVLKCNPATKLYLRLGFVQTNETDTHVSLTWKHRSRLVV